MVIVSDLVMTFDPAASDIVVAGEILCVEVAVLPTDVQGFTSSIR